MSSVPSFRPTLSRTAAAGAVLALGAVFAAPAHAVIVDDPITVSGPGAALALSPLGSHDTGVFDESAAEIVAHHPATQRLFSVDALAGDVRVLDVADASSPTALFSLSAAGVVDADGVAIPAGAVANSVAVREDGLVAVAVESDPKTDDGWLVFFDAAGDGAALGAVRLGAQPDMVAITPDGTRAVVANEGEPDDDYAVDPEGSVAVVDLPAGVDAPGQDAVSIADFHAFEDGALADGVRIFAGIAGIDLPVSRGLEPEYVAIDAASATAYVTLQENNAVAVVDIASATVTDVMPLGAKDFSQQGYGLDPSDRDDAIDIRTFPIQGLYMPDSIGAYTAVDGRTYLVTANEGDAREWGDYEEPVRLKDLGEDAAPLCEGVLDEALLADEELGRLDVTTASGLSEDGSCYEEVFAFGGRSFSIWTTDGTRVFDSGDDFERITAQAAPEFFNSDNAASTFESRSDAKGPEPEGLTIGEVGGRTYAFIGLERVGGIVVYDVTNPHASRFVTYLNNRDFSVSAEDEIEAIEEGEPSEFGSAAEVVAAAGDMGPEGLAFIAAEDSPTGAPLLAVGNEVSGSTTLYAIDTVKASARRNG